MIKQDLKHKTIACIHWTRKVQLNKVFVNKNKRKEDFFKDKHFKLMIYLIMILSKYQTIRKIKNYSFLPKIFILLHNLWKIK